MELGKSGWLSTLVESAVLEHVPPVHEGHGSARSRARQYLKAVLRESGLLYGTPAQSASRAPASGRSPEEVLFLAVLRTLVRIVLDIAVLVEAPPGPRRAQVMVLLATQVGELAAANALDQAARLGELAPRRLLAKVESALAERAISLSGDPSYGLVLHNGAVYADAHALGRQAIDYFVRGRFSRRSAERRRYVSAQQKAVLVEVLAALACVERPPSFPARRAILRQIDDLGLPDDLSAELRRRVKEDFERRPSLRRIVASARSPDMRRFLLEQTLLASLVDGRRSPEEIAFLSELAATLQTPPAELKRVELEMAEFYAKNRNVVDVFTVAAGAGMMGEELVESMQRTVERNFQRLIQEVRETGELSVLIARAARGQTLNTEERQRMRAQLIDVAKAIPARALFAAPGGVLLLIALAKVLPFDLLPSSFRPPKPEKDSNESP